MTRIQFRLNVQFNAYVGGDVSVAFTRWGYYVFSPVKEGSLVQYPASHIAGPNAIVDSPEITAVAEGSFTTAGVYQFNIFYGEPATDHNYINFEGGFAVNSDGGVSGGTLLPDGGGGGNACAYAIYLEPFTALCKQEVKLSWREIVTGRQSDGSGCPVDTSWTVWRSVGAGYFEQIATTTHPTYSDSDATLPFGITVTYYVKGVQTGTQSNNAPVVLGCSPVVQCLGICQGNAADLFWAAITGATGYVLQRDDVTIYSGPALMFHDTGVVAGTVYVYMLAAVFRSVQTESGPPLSVTPCAIFVPPAPPTEDYTPEAPPTGSYSASSCAGTNYIVSGGCGS